MADILRNLFLALTQIPLLAGFWIWWTHLYQRPVYAAVLAIMYEGGVFVFAFSKKVWTKIEDKAVKATADWILATVVGFAPGFRRRYKQQLINDHSVFNVLGLGLINTYRLSLEQVFVNLRVDTSNPQHFNIDLTSEREFARGKTIWEFLRLEHPTFREATALAIIGPPGSGKTTLMQHVTITLAGNRQHRYGLRAYIPLLLFLRNHIKEITQEGALALGKLAQDYFSDHGLFPSLRPPEGWFENRLQRGKCLVILDGLDEVPDLQQRRIISAWVDSQIKNYPNCRFVLTSRPQGYRDAALQRAHVLEVQPFNAKQVRKFIENWYLANEVVSVGGKNDPEVRKRASKDANDLIERLRNAPSLRSLTVNPLLLTMLVMVDRYHGDLPGSRVELYAEICEVLLGRWRQSRGVRDTTTAAQKLVVLRFIAANMMTRKLRDIAATDLIELAAKPLNRVGLAAVDTKSFLTDLQANSALLLEREAGRWSFAHLTFQEYLTSCYWLEQRNIDHDWITLVDDSWWVETLRLYAAQADASFLVQACVSSNSERALMLAADCLDEALELDNDVRAAAEDCVIAALESIDSDRRRLAAEVRLSRRLKRLQLTANDQCEIDLDYLSCAEYQLFLNEMAARCEYHQPDHWLTNQFVPGDARTAIAGVRAEDANAFCQWLTLREGSNVLYRLPSPDEAMQYPAKTACLAAWCGHAEKFFLIGLTDSEVTDLRRDLETLSSLPMLPLTDIFLNSNLYTRALDFAHTFARALLLLPVFELEFDHRGLLLSRTIATYFDHALQLVHTRNPALGIQELELDRAKFLIAALTTSRISNLFVARGYVEEGALFEESEFESLRHGRNGETRLANLLSDLQTIIVAESTEVACRAKRKCISRILEFSYIAYQEFVNTIKNGQYHYLKRSPDVFKLLDDLERLEPIFLRLYWWLQVVIAREEGRMRAWEGVRLVREQVLEKP